MKYLLPALFSTPTIFVWGLLVFSVFTGIEIPWAIAVVGLSFLSFTACVAMLFIRPESKEWRVAALFNAAPFVLLLAWVLVGAGA